MAWSDNMLTMLRILINDYDYDDLTYSDTQLKQILAMGARYVSQELDFATDYVTTLSPPSITPDPTTNGASDDSAFENLSVMRAACFIDWNSFRSKALLSGLEAKCGPAVLSTVKHMDGFKELLEKGPCAAYEVLKQQWMWGNSRVVRAILSPFISNDFDPADLSPLNHTYRDED